MQKSVSIAAYADPDLKKKIIRYAKDFPAAVVCDSNTDLLPDSLFSYKKYDLVAGLHGLSIHRSIFANFQHYTGSMSITINGTLDLLHTMSKIILRILNHRIRII
jgi:hypothetical protein